MPYFLLFFTICNLIICTPNYAKPYSSELNLSSEEASCKNGKCSDIQTLQPNSWSKIGEIIPETDLNPGDKIIIRAFGVKGEIKNWRKVLKISDYAYGNKYVWAYNLANMINSSTTLRAGTKSGNSYNAHFGINNIYSHSESGIEQVEITIEYLSDSADHLPPRSPSRKYKYLHSAVP